MLLLDSDHSIYDPDYVIIKSDEMQIESEYQRQLNFGLQEDEIPSSKFTFCFN